ncbi:MAG: methylated-DNA--[protein]-cysteine S-methyltransferase [Verrucomicrobiota bacterium]
MGHYERIARVIRHLDGNFREQPRLSELAKVAGLSESRFHRVFSEWAGVTPKDFLQCLTSEYAKGLLRRGRSVLDVSLDSGLSGPGRLHDLSVSLEGASPGEIKSGGAGWMIEWGVSRGPFGDFLIAEGPRGLCGIHFLDMRSCDEVMDTVKADWPNAIYQRSDRRATEVGDCVFGEDAKMGRLKAYVKGSEFQVRVWRALLQIPEGALESYGSIASSIGMPKALRAVGTAIGANKLAYLIPCHRVVRESGAIGGYRWGEMRKRAMIACGR